MDERDPILSVRDLSITFPGTIPFPAVKELSFSVAKGETLAIVGESGSGKSLTALALMGLLPSAARQTGTINLFSEAGTNLLTDTLTRRDWASLRGSVLGMVFQEPMSSLNPVMRIGVQISEAILAHQTISSEAAKQKALEWLHKVQLPNPAAIYSRFPHELSGGQKQRVMIAMAMCNHPLLLIADEPTTALDVTVQAEIISLMKALQRQEGIGLIFITHDLAIAATIADRVVVMYRGSIVEQGPASRVLGNPAHPYTRALLACRPSQAAKGVRLLSVEEALDPAGKAEKPGTRFESEAKSNPDSDPEALLEVSGLRVWFPLRKDWFGRPLEWYRAVDDVSFKLYDGEVLGLVGESGCGKSTLGKALTGLLPINGGQVLFEGRELSAIPPGDWRDIRRRMQIVFQDPFSSLNPRMNIRDMLGEPLQVHGIVPRREIDKEARRLLGLVQLPVSSLRKYPHEFSGGQRQRLGIARALALRPRLLICDEMVSALDVSVQAQILNLLKDLQKELSLSYLFISHDLSVVHYLSDRIMVMQAGHIVESGTADQILRSPAHPYTQKLFAATPHQ